MTAYFLLTAVTLSIDILTVGIAYGIRKIRFNNSGWATFLLTGLCVVFLAATVGKMLKLFALGKYICGGLLIATGSVMVLHQLDFSTDLPFFRLISSPEKSDPNNNHTIEITEAFFLSLALSMDSCIACLGSGNAVLAALVFIFQPIFLKFGLLLGTKFVVKGCENICGIISGVLLFTLGVGNFL